MRLYKDYPALLIQTSQRPDQQVLKFELRKLFCIFTQVQTLYLNRCIDMAGNQTDCALKTVLIRVAQSCRRSAWSTLHIMSRRLMLDDEIYADP